MKLEKISKDTWSATFGEAAYIVRESLGGFKVSRADTGKAVTLGKDKVYAIRQGIEAATAAKPDRAVVGSWKPPRRSYLAYRQPRGTVSVFANGSRYLHRGTRQEFDREFQEMRRSHRETTIEARLEAFRARRNPKADAAAIAQYRERVAQHAKRSRRDD